MIARQKANPVETALRGWQMARVVMAANRLDLFNAIGEKALTVDEVALLCCTHPRSTTLLLNACAGMGILVKEGERYRLAEEAKESLLKGRPGYMGDAINHMDHLWRVWAELPEAVRTNRPARFKGSVSPDQQVFKDFIMAMHNLAMQIGGMVADLLDMRGRRLLLDLGGGPGTYSVFLCQRYPNLRAVVFDLPEAMDIAKEIISSFGLQERIATRAGDYFVDDFGKGNDVVFISQVLHSMGAENCRLILKKACDSLKPGGMAAVHEGLISPDGLSPLSTALFSLNMLLNTGEGKSYSGEEITSFMLSAGFTSPEVRPLPDTARTALVIAYKS